MRHPSQTEAGRAGSYGELVTCVSRKNELAYFFVAQVHSHILQVTQSIVAVEPCMWKHSGHQQRRLRLELIYVAF